MILYYKIKLLMFLSGFTGKQFTVKVNKDLNVITFDYKRIGSDLNKELFKDREFRKHVHEYCDFIVGVK